MMHISKFRIRAFIMHLSISLVISLLALIVVFFIWYPNPLDKATGVTNIFIIMLVLDICLGPLLTLILAKKGKKGLKLDLFTVAILQVIALLYGVTNIAQSRPVWIVFDVLRFEVVQANELVYVDEIKIPAEFMHPSWLGPKYAAVIPSKDIAEKNKRIFDELKTGVSPSMQVNLYEDLGKSWTIIESKQKPLVELKKVNNPDLVDKYIIKYQNKNITGWLPLKAYEKSMVVFVNTKNREIVKIVDLIPYE